MREIIRARYDHVWAGPNGDAPPETRPRGEAVPVWGRRESEEVSVVRDVIWT